MPVDRWIDQCINHSLNQSINQSAISGYWQSTYNYLQQAQQQASTWQINSKSVPGQNKPSVTDNGAAT